MRIQTRYVPSGVALSLRVIVNVVAEVRVVLTTTIAGVIGVLQFGADVNTIAAPSPDRLTNPEPDREIIWTETDTGIAGIDRPDTE